MPETPRVVAYRHYAELAESAKGLLGDFWRNHAMLSVVAAGYHPFYGRGAELTQAILADLEDGFLVPPVTVEKVWAKAEDLDMVLEFEWPPVAPPPEKEEDDARE